MGHRLLPGSGLMVLSELLMVGPAHSLPSLVGDQSPPRCSGWVWMSQGAGHFPRQHRWVGLRAQTPPHPPIFFSSSRFSRNTSIPAPEPTPSLHFSICKSFAHAPSLQPSRTSPPGRHGSRHSSSLGTHYQGSGRASSGPGLVLGRTWLAMWDSHHLSFSFGLLPELLC